MDNALKTNSVLAITGIIGVLIINALAVLLPINEMSTGDVSALYPNYFVPAGFTFSIWSVIYLLLIAYCIYTLKIAFRPQGYQQVRPLLSPLSKLFLITCLFNIGWIFLWHYLQVRLSLVVMISLLVTLIIIYREILYYRDDFSFQQWMLIQAPFSVYLGWISVATIANTTAVLVNGGWDGGPLSPVHWAALMMLVATALGVYFVWKWKDPAYALVICWALFGIYKKQENGPAVLTTTALIGMALLLVIIGIHYWKRSQKKSRVMNPGP